MSGIVIDEDVIDKKNFRRLKKVVGQKLEKVKLDYEDLILEFEKTSVTISRQYSDVYGDNVFWNFEKSKSEVR